MSNPWDGMTLVFSDAFTYSGSPPADPAKWFLGDPRPGNAGYGTAKMLLRADTNINTVLTGGGGSDLQINATYDTAYNATYGTNWITTQLSSAWNNGSGAIAGVGVRKGYFEVQMTVPFDPNAQGRAGGTGNGSGTWAAFWFEQFKTILGTGPTAEIDVELYGVGDNQFPATSQWWPLTTTGPSDAMGNTTHTFWSVQVGNTSGFPTIADFQGVRTTFGVLIDDYNVTWYVNNVLQCVIPLVMPEDQDPYFVMIAMEMGGGWPIVNPPAAPNNKYSLAVHSVKIYQAPMSTIANVTSATITPVSSTTFDIAYTTSAPLPLPTFTPASSPTTTGSVVTIGTVAPGTSGDTLSIQLSHDNTFSSGSSLVLSGSNVNYTPGTITSGNAGTDTITFLVTESNGAVAGFNASITLSYVSGGAGNGLVMSNVSRSTQLANFNTALAAVKAGTPGARCVIVCTGDSTTAGVTAVSSPSAETPYPDQLAIALGSISGVPHNFSSFYGDQLAFQYITFTGSAAWNFGLSGPGAGSLSFSAINDSATWAPTDTRLVGTFDRIDVTYYDAGGAGTVNVVIAGNTYPLNFTGTSNNVKTQTLTIAAITNPTNVVFRFVAGTYAFVIGAALWSHATPSIEVRNVGVGGSTVQQLQTTLMSGINQVFGIMNQNPHLVIINFGINDINFSGNSGAETLSQFESYLDGGITAFKAPGGSFSPADVLVVCPQPFTPTTSPAPTFTQTQLVAGELSVAVARNVPIADLNATYGGNGTAFQATSLSSGSVHPSAAGYADIALRIASFLTNTAQTYASVGLAGPITGSGWVLD